MGSPFVDVTILKQIGEGSFAKVYYGLWTGNPVAVKIIESTSKNSADKSVFEALLSSTLSHPNIVQTFKHSSRQKFEDRSVVPKDSLPTSVEQLPNVLETWIVTEWCDRGTLSQICQTPRVDPMHTKEVWDILREITSAGSYLHFRGVIHGDLTTN